MRFSITSRFLFSTRSKTEEWKWEYCLKLRILCKQMEFSVSWAAYGSHARSLGCLLEQLSFHWRCFLCQRFPWPKDQYSAESPRICYDSCLWQGSDPCQTQTTCQKSHPAMKTRTLVKSSQRWPDRAVQTSSPQSDWSWWRYPPCRFHSCTAHCRPRHRQKRSATFPLWWWPFPFVLCTPAEACSFRPPHGPTGRSRPALWCSHSRQKVLGSLPAREVKTGKKLTAACSHFIFFCWLILISTCLHTVGDGVIGANVEPAEAPELPQGPGEPVFRDVGVGGVLVWETQLL